jgi:excisionase family DNA binding protein
MKGQWSRSSASTVETKIVLITIGEAARLLSCSPGAIRKWLTQRRLVRVKVGRLTRLRLEEVERVAAQGLHGPEDRSR